MRNDFDADINTMDTLVFLKLVAQDFQKFLS